jgi:lipoic acid synthetase
MDKENTTTPSRLPPWIKVKLHQGENFRELNTIVTTQNLHTVCQEAHCPNIYECWNRKTATFMILGDICTRACRFCAVVSGRPTELDLGEPLRVARSVAALGLKHAVITSVDRDDLADGGAMIFVNTIRAIRHKCPNTTIEVLTPDFQGDKRAIEMVARAKPDIFNHNVETVPRLYARVRPKADFQRSCELLSYVKSIDSTIITKSGLMVGLGETKEELIDTFKALRRHHVDVLTVGQYLRPTKKHLPVEKYYHPDEFKELKEIALSLGFAHVESGPLVRSSYHADEHIPSVLRSALGAGA